MQTSDGEQINVGDAVQFHPATDIWMSGDRYGTVNHVGDSLVTVHAWSSGNRYRVNPENLVSHTTD